MEYIVRKELKVEVYTIGYEPEGEGVVVKIKSDGTTKFCLVIDCYEIGDNWIYVKFLDTFFYEFIYFFKLRLSS